MRNNLHLAINSFRYGSRILKETASIVQTGVADHVYIVALHDEGLSEHEELDAGRSVWRVRLKSRSWSQNLFFQLVKYVEYCVHVILYARTRNIRLVNIHHLALLPIGVLLKWIYGAKLVYDTHELETETYGLRGVRQSLARLVERMLIKQADLIIVVSDGIEMWYRDKYRLTNTVTVLNCPAYKEIPRTRRLHQELNIPDEKKIILYQGGLIKGRGIEKLLSAFAENGDERYSLVFMGYGVLEALINEYASSHSGIYFKQAVSPAVVLQYTASADVGVSYIDNSSLNDHWCLPNKFFEYIQAKLPVIVNDVPEMKRVVNENRIGIVLNELTTKSLKEALDDISRMDTEVLSNNLKRAAELFSWGNQERSMVAAYDMHVFPRTK